MPINGSKFYYAHGEAVPCNAKYINACIVALCRKHGVRSVLDLGCGNGSLCRELVDAGFQVVGMDPSESGIANARKLVAESRFYVMGVYDRPEAMQEDGFDMVVSTEVIEHLYQPSALLSFALAKLKPSGLLLVSTPYHGYLKNLAISLAGKWDTHHSPWWDGGHIKFWSRKSLACFLESNGLEVIDFVGAGRLPWIWKTMIITARKTMIAK